MSARKKPTPAQIREARAYGRRLAKAFSAASDAIDRLPKTDERRVCAYIVAHVFGVRAEPPPPAVRKAARR